jgi:Peptidyl-prolyl cis-trans isomerase (rotamase) - cyclophilin family
MKKKMFTMLVITALAISMIACGNETETKQAETNQAETNETIEEEQQEEQTQQGENEEETNMTNPVVTIELESGKVIKAELYPNIAPNTVNNFISLINAGYYDGLIFHRVIQGFMIQGGCPEGVGTGGPGYQIAGEFSQNGFENNLSHAPGVLSMARSAAPDSAGSQFFIMHEQSPHLDGAYAGFGQVIEGMDIVNEIAETQTDAGDRPVEEQKIRKVTVDTFGETYEEPTKA